MAVQNIPRKVGPTTGNGILKEFPFSFKTVRASDVVVKTSAGTGVTDEEVTLRYGSDYTVTMNSNQDERPGGSVVLVNAPAKGVRVVVTSDTAIDQQLVLTNHDGFLPESLNDAYDKLTIICQELKETLSRCLKVPSTSNKTPEELLKEIFEAAKSAVDSAESAAKDAIRSESAADRAEAGAQRVEDILANYESGVICKSFKAADPRWTQVSTAYGPKYRLALNIGSTALIGVYSGTTDSAEKVITGVLLSGENVTIEVPEPFTGFLFTAMFTKQVADYVYVKPFTNEDLQLSGTGYVLSVPASEHKCGKTPAIIELVKITNGKRERFYAYDEVDAEGNLQITASEPFDGELILDGGYLKEEI